MIRVVILFGLLLMLPPQAHVVFASEQPKIAEEPWDHLPIRVYIDDVNTPAMWDGAYRDAVLSALRYWEEDGAKKLSYRPVFQQVDDPDEADITICWVENIGEGGEFPKGVAGYAQIQRHTIDGMVRFERVDIVLEVAEKKGLLWWAHGKKTARVVAMHELGHALGLDHSNERGDVMNPVFVERHEPSPQMLTYLSRASPLVVILLALFIGHAIVGYTRARKRRRRLESAHFEEPLTLQYRRNRR